MKARSLVPEKETGPRTDEVILKAGAKGQEGGLST